MKAKFTILALCLFFAANQLLAQCGPLVITSSTTTPASCPGNGSIKVNATGTSLTYKLIAGPDGFSGANNSTGNFTSLVAGEYTVEVKDFCGETKTATYTVNNTYPAFSVTDIAATGVCETGTKGGTITANVAGGNPNYQYDIVPIGTEPVYGASTVSTTYSETVTAFGTYRFYVKDACGEVRTTDIDLFPKQATPTRIWYEEVLLNRPCDEEIGGIPTITWALHLRDQNGQGINFYDMVGATYQIYRPSTPNSINASANQGACTIAHEATPIVSGTIEASGIADQWTYHITIPQEDVILVFTNRCGETFKYCYNFNGGLPIESDITVDLIQQSCNSSSWDAQNISVRVRIKKNLKPTITYVLKRVSDGVTLATNTTGIFNNVGVNNLPATVTATDACGRTVTKTINKPEEGSDLVFEAVPEYNLTCTNIRGTSTAVIRILGGDLPGINNANNVVSITGGTAAAPPSISLCRESIPGFYASNLLAGYTYTISITNQCGENETFNFTVPANNWGQVKLDWNLTATANALCGQNKSSIIAKANYTGNRQVWFELFDGDPFTDPGANQIGINTTGTFTNVPPGEYWVYMSIAADASCPDRKIIDKVKVTVISDEGGQSIDRKTVTTCEIDGTPTEFGKAIINVNGSGPYTYEIIKTSLIGTGAEVWTVSSSNNPNSSYSWDIPMAGDPMNTIYTLRSTDKCGNKITTQASLQPFEAPVLEKQQHPCAFTTSDYTLSIKPYAGNFTYIWIKVSNPDEILSNQNTLTFPGLYHPSYDGKYRCIVKLDGCIERTLDVTINSVQCASPLPVKLVSFSGAYSNSSAQLKWVSADEVSFSHFEVERSVNAVDFVKVMDVQAKNNGASTNSYAATDNLNNFTSNIVYYRLKMMDLDGKFSYSSVIRLSIKADDMQLLVYPNPTRSSVSLAFTSNATTTADVKVFDKLGRIAISKSIKVIKGNNAFRLAETENLPIGSYMIEVKTSTQIQTSKFVKF